MGKFDGILLCSDIDGTILLNSNFDKIFELNKSAIRYFTDNGGKFTFVTGRYMSFLTGKHLRPLINIPAGIFNGAAVYDYEREKMLYIKRLGHSCIELANAVGCFKDSLVRFTPILNTYGDTADPMPLDVPKEYADKKPIKCVYVFDSAESAVKFKSFLLTDRRFDDCYISRSWDISVELTNGTATKGHAAKYIKRFIGAHTLITIGDYENDIPMLELADLGAAVGSAPDIVKSAADIVVKPCKDGAIADLISIIEKQSYKKQI